MARENFRRLFPNSFFPPGVRDGFAMAHPVLSRRGPEPEVAEMHHSHHSRPCSSEGQSRGWAGPTQSPGPREETATRRTTCPRKHSEAGGGRPECGGEWAAKTEKRPPQQPAQLQCANHWAQRTRKRHHKEHWSQWLTERSDPMQHAKGRTGDCPGPRKDGMCHTGGSIEREGVALEQWPRRSCGTVRVGSILWAGPQPDPPHKMDLFSPDSPHG